MSPVDSTCVQVPEGARGGGRGGGAIVRPPGSGTTHHPLYLSLPCPLSSVLGYHPQFLDLLKTFTPRPPSQLVPGSMSRPVHPPCSGTVETKEPARTPPFAHRQSADSRAGPGGVAPSTVRGSLGRGLVVPARPPATRQRHQREGGGASPKRPDPVLRTPGAPLRDRWESGP